MVLTLKKSRDSFFLGLSGFAGSLFTSRLLRTTTIGL